MTENLAEKIREDRRPEGEMFDLAGESRRLRNSLAVAQRWLEVATAEDETGLMTTKAEYTRDQLEEELSRTTFKMEVLRRQKELRHARPVEDPDGTARAAVLSDSLLSAYCALRDAPAETFGGESPDQERYALMGGAHGRNGRRQRRDGAGRGQVSLAVAHGQHRTGVSLRTAPGPTL